MFMRIESYFARLPGSRFGGSQRIKEAVKRRKARFGIHVVKLLFIIYRFIDSINRPSLGPRNTDSEARKLALSKSTRLFLYAPWL